ncbi:hypothetical protein B0H63DRAFT_454213 [Podospora didyma]|uniref:G domain-containing protein n=1 Tax=Podospora didyma TaxID=330526 RepID=A0AAE0N4J4_9PEZI|nr:hypothetical protein B0H63DRAFT_454213 [Podospora didyma]
MVIGIMGVTGSGKSTFVQVASGNNDVVVGHSLEACTQKVTAYKFNLEVTYRQNAKLTGIIYLHRITDVRMDGSAMRSLKMFRKLCGEQPMKNVVIASTFWGAIDEDKAIAHEAELMGKADFWEKATVTLDIQRELVDEDKPLGETAVGNAVNEELQRLEHKYKTELERIQQETAAALAEKDVHYEKILKKEREKMETKLERIHTDQEMLRRERLMKREYQSKLEKQQLEADRKREEDRDAIRGQVRDVRMQNAIEMAAFRDRMMQIQTENEDQLREVRAENKSLRAASMATAHRGGGGNIGGKIVNLVAAGAFAAFDPLGIPLVVAALGDFVDEF